MTLYKRGNVYWTYVWADGVRHAKSTQTGNKRLAQRIDEQYKEELLSLVRFRTGSSLTSPSANLQPVSLRKPVPNLTTLTA